VSPLDPQIFSTIAEYAAWLTEPQVSAKYSPIDVALWLERCVNNSKDWLNAALRATKNRNGGAFRRIEEDVHIQIGLGTFFAHKLRSAVLYELFQRTNRTDLGNAAVDHYQKARDAWAAMAVRATKVYRANVSYGSIPKRSGHWADRLSGIDADLAAMKLKIQRNNADTVSPLTSAKESGELGREHSVGKAISTHRPPENFRPGEPLPLRLIVSKKDADLTVRSVRLRYRHVDQAERWSALDATREDGAYIAAIPAEYTQSKFALEYYFDLEDGTGAQWMYPGFNETLSNQPYFAVCKRIGYDGTGTSHEQ
jgi:hypothetical protein